MEIYMVYIVEPEVEAPFDVFIGSSLEKARDFLRQALLDVISGIEIDTIIHIDVDEIDVYFSDKAKCVGIKSVGEWLQ